MFLTILDELHSGFCILSGIKYIHCALTFPNMFDVLRVLGVVSVLKVSGVR